MHGAVKLLLFVPLPRTSICLIVNKANSTNQIMSILCICTVLPAKSDSDVMFCYKVIRNLESIYQLCINPIPRIGLIQKWIYHLCINPIPRIGLIHTRSFDSR